MKAKWKPSKKWMTARMRMFSSEFCLNQMILEWFCFFNVYCMPYASTCGWDVREGGERVAHHAVKEVISFSSNLPILGIIRVHFKGGTRYLVELGTLNREKTSAKNSCHVVPMKWWSEGWALAGGERWKRWFAQRCAERWPAIPQGESTSWFGGSRC